MRPPGLSSACCQHILSWLMIHLNPDFASGGMLIQGSAAGIWALGPVGHFRGGHEKPEEFVASAPKRPFTVHLSRTRSSRDRRSSWTFTSKCLQGLDSDCHRAISIS